MTMTFQLLIVDDEAPVRKGLSSFINWESIGCSVCDTACDGYDAIEKIKNNHIDIVLTDVKMPELDGLGLAKYIYETHPEIAVIMLTGYAEFEYAQKAINYHVVQFLLKPTSKDEVISAVKSAQQKIITSKEHDEIAKSEVAFLIERMLQEMVYATPSPETEKKLNEHGILLDSYYIASFQLNGNQSEISQLKELIIQHKVNSYCFRYDNLILSIHFSDQLECVSDSCSEIVQILDTLYGIKVSIGISQLHHGGLEFSSAITEAIHALSLNFYSTSCIALFNGQNIQADSALSTDTSLALFELETAVFQRDFSKAYSITNTMFMKLQSSFSSPSYVKNICSQIYYLTFRVMAKYKKILPPESYIDDIIKATDIFQLESIISELLQFAKRSFTDSGKKYSAHITDTISYIQEHLTENLSLEILAQNVHMNDTYLSRTFKKESGYSIIEYITMLRIEKAKELLANKNILTYEISEQIGFSDPSYFSLLFKKYTGMSPKEYRHQFIYQ
jgi:two-component system response regulator YesN